MEYLIPQNKLVQFCSAYITQARVTVGTGLFVIGKVVNFLPFVKDGSFKTKAIAQGFYGDWFNCKELRVGCNFLHGQNIFGRNLI